MKYLASWEPHLLDQYFTQDSVNHELAAALEVLLLHVTRNHFLPKKIIFNQRNISWNNRLSHLSRNNFLPHKTLFHVPRNYFSSQEIIVSFLKLITYSVMVPCRSLRLSIFCHNKQIYSCYRRVILVTRNNFLGQEINYCQKKSILVRRIYFLWLSFFYKLGALHESYQLYCLS